MENLLGDVKFLVAFIEMWVSNRIHKAKLKSFSIALPIRPLRLTYQ